LDQLKMLRCGSDCAVEGKHRIEADQGAQPGYLQVCAGQSESSAGLPCREEALHQIAASSAADLFDAAQIENQFLLAKSGLPHIVPSPASAQGATGGPLGFPPWIRWSHFFNMIFLFMLMHSGLSILMDHPRLYWNDHCTPGSEWIRLRIADQ
jgi:hypothetical protein